MIVTKQQSEEMLEVAKPLIKWLNENCHPHCEVTVTVTTVALSESIASQRTVQFLRD